MKKWKKRIALALAGVLLTTTPEVSGFSVSAQTTGNVTAIIEAGVEPAEENTKRTIEAMRAEEGSGTEDQTMQEIFLGDAFVLKGHELTSGRDYSWDGSTLTILSGKAITIANKKPDDAYSGTIKVSSDVSANITLAGINLERSTSPFIIENNSNGHVTITLEKDTKNFLKCWQKDIAALKKNGLNGSLTIQGTGSLEVVGGENGAGIGSDRGKTLSNIHIKGGVITAIGGIYGAGIGGSTASEASNITISGGVVTAIAGKSAAGIGGGGSAAGSNITISGGVVTATGGNDGAGIGSGISKSASNITISGGVVTATGGKSAAGIGGGSRGKGTDITISGGEVTAIAGLGGGGIGGGLQSIGSGVKITGGSVRALANTNAIGSETETVVPVNEQGEEVYLLEIRNTNREEKIKINGKDYPRMHDKIDKIYVYLPAKNETDPNQVEIGDMVTKYYYQNGRWYSDRDTTIEDTGNGIDIESIFHLKAADGEIITQDDYTYQDKVLTIHSRKKITISNIFSEEPVESRILIENNGDSNIALNGINIDVSYKKEVSPFEIIDGDSSGDVTLTLVEDSVNILKGGELSAGLQKNSSTSLGKLIIQGTGTLEAMSGEYAAGIGGDYKESTEKITINGGVITAIGAWYGAGIGGGSGGSASDITINGGTVTATATSITGRGSYGAGIGGGSGGSASDITISGGMVTAMGSSQAAGIGGGSKGSASDITISGGMVTAVGGKYGAGIGGGSRGSGSNITIDSSSVKIIAGEGANIIGGGKEESAIIPVNKAGEELYLLEMKNELGEDLQINGTDYPDKHTYMDETNTMIQEEKIYVYLPAKTETEPNEIVHYEPKSDQDDNGNLVEIVRGKYHYANDKWNIRVDIPKEDETIYYYNEQPQTYGIVSSAYYTVDYAEHTDIGSYHVRVSLKPGIQWSNGETGSQMYTFSIVKNIPRFSSDSLPTIHGIYGQALRNMKLNKYEDTSENGIYGMWKISQSDSGNIYPSIGDKQKYTVRFCPEIEKQEYCEELSVEVPVFVEPKLLEIKSVIAEDRMYDIVDQENRIVPIKSIELEGVVGEEEVFVDLDKVQGAVSSSNAGNYTTLTITQVNTENLGNYLPLVGKDAGNYLLAIPTEAVPTQEAGVTIKKENSQITLYKEHYERTFGDGEFLLEGITDNNPEAEVIYTTEGKGIVHVSEGGKVTILGAGEETITLSLEETTNYHSAENREITVQVAKVESTPIEIHRNYVYTKTSPDTISLAELLPEDCGNITYETPVVEGTVTYETAPAVTDGVLSYTLSTGAPGEEGIITQTVTTENYEDITITIKIQRTDKEPVQVKDNGSVTLQENVLVYGEALSKLSFGETVFVNEEGREVEGTLAWKEATLTPNTGTTSATWVFTPEDVAYQTLEGNVAIIVEKATPVIGKVEGTALTEGEALQNSALTGEAHHSEEQAVEVEGTFTWKDGTLKPKAADSGVTEYAVTFTPEDMGNYNCVDGTVKLVVEPSDPAQRNEQDPEKPEEGENGNESQKPGTSQEEISKEVQTAKEQLETLLQNVTGQKDTKYTQQEAEMLQKIVKEAQDILQKSNVTKLEVTEVQKKLEMALKTLGNLKEQQKPQEQQPAQPQEQNSTKPGTEFKDTKGIYKFRIQKDGQVIFTGVTKSIKTVKIADTVTYAGKTWKVTRIAAKALKGDKIVTTVAVGKNVKNIGASAFEGCEKLTKVTLKNQVTTIGNKAFKQCKPLKKITIPVKVKKLGKSVFEGCKKLSKITIKATGLKSVGKNTFQGIAPKAKIKVPKKNQKAYQKLLKNKGQGKKVTVK